MSAPVTQQNAGSKNVFKPFLAFLMYFAALISIYVFTSKSQLRGTMQIFHFVIFAQVVLTSMSMYLWKHLVSNFTTPTVKLSKSSSDLQNSSKSSQNNRSIPQTLWRIVMCVFLFLAQISLFIGRLYPAKRTPYTFVMMSYSCLGVYAILFGVLLPLELIEILLRRIRLSHKVSFGKGFKAFAVVSVSIALAIHGLYKALDGPVVKHVEIPVHKLPETFHGMTVVQLSDIHLGPTVGGKMMKDVVKKVNKLKPDLVLITGDLVESPVDSLSTAVEPLSKLQTKYGTYFSTGNHEYHAGDVNKWFDHLEFLGVHCLHNKHIQIRHETTPTDWFYLAGTDDWQGYMFGGDHGFDLDKTMKDTDTDHAVILMAHQPNAAKAALNSRYDFSLILSGHTHGGQFFPMNILIYLMNPFYAGLYQISDQTYVYVSSGTWYYGPPIRILSTPEITCITFLAP